MKSRICLTVAALAANAAPADTIASQNFNVLSDANTFTTDTFPATAVDMSLTNAGSQHTGGPSLDFDTVWTGTRGNQGPLDPATQSTGDFIGVSSFSGSNAPDVAPDGTPFTSGIEHNFGFGDGDGLLEQIFEAVNIAGFTNVTLSLDYWINETGYEADDLFEVILSDGITDVDVLSLGETGLEANVSPDNGTANWNSLSFDISSSSLVGPLITLTVAVDNNSGLENIFIDNVEFSGTFIPEPSTIALAGLGLLGVAGAALRRRRSA